ncbi:MAG: hypothetical protein G01um101413_777 [Parcubacteria group bacterium Gr01-1014_13]|nr:MAG: hypothetical protein G01um101413_777 [Parcubacteria group bacterium Gr01-1014_13]
MKNTVLSTIFCALLAACSPNVTPVDMEYNVSVETIEDTCGNDPAPDGLTIPFNVALQTDNKINVWYPAGYAPGRGDYKGFIIYDGQTDFESKRPSKTGPGDDVVRISGSLTMDFMDITIEERRWRQEETEPVPCIRKARLRGAARPFSTLTALDGKYEAYYDFYELVCPPGQPQENDPVPWTVPLDIKDQNGSALFAFDSYDENLMFAMPTETLASGNIDWDGAIYLIGRTSGIFYEFEGNVAGKFVDGSYYLRIKFHEIGDTTGCDFVLDANGAKRMPDPTSISNTYRLAFLESDACRHDAFGDITLTKTEQEGEIVFHTDGRLTLMHSNERFNLKAQTDGSYTGSWSAGGVTLKYKLTAAPPNLSFSFMYAWPTDEGYCDIATEVAGVPRYFPGLALTTPKRTSENLQMARYSSNATEKLNFKSLGLAAKIKNRARLHPLSEAPQFVREAILAR